jgi:SAM-dependent methyltransferase
LAPGAQVHNRGVVVLSSDASFESLLEEAEQLPLTGWDFGVLGDRLRSSELDLSYERLVANAAQAANAMLDLGTGGGEWLAAFAARPPLTVATESWPPNIEVARRSLAPLGVEVVQVDPAPDNALQADADHGLAPLPFGYGSFDLISARHEAFVASEISRVLTAAGSFITQQISDAYFAGYRRLLGLPVADRPRWTAEVAVAQLADAGLQIDHIDQGSAAETFTDVGALAWYLRKVPWCVPEFSIDSFREPLHNLDRAIRSNGPLVIPVYGFVVCASKQLS